MITSEILDLLKVDDAELEEILEACDWTGTTEFTDEQSETLLVMKTLHDEKGHDYIDAYLRSIGQRLQVNDTLFNEIYAAIEAANGFLIDYRDRFEEICQLVNDCVSPAEAIIPPQPVVEDTPSVVEAEADPESVQMDRFITEQANAAIVVTMSQIKGFADLAYEEQERLKTLFMTKYRQGLAKELLSEEFKAEFMARMTASLEGKGAEKKQGELTGVQNPTPLLSSSN
ncbi:hypothetical protein [Acaryochloris marina]|uniref:hypothetical protein n=1 Tax=Acaryochloris marina TaxID=155978 RepID=UPI0021C39419|nr:hypothetical protein [Acaryochloris marina]BDM83894.1 hypothetical protein AM10699_67550 [Acaryochloris marina MBIC10699]